VDDSETGGALKPRPLGGAANPGCGPSFERVGPARRSAAAKIGRPTELLTHTRRELLLTLPAAALASAAPKESIAYVSTYTRADSKGIYAYRFNSGSGKLTQIGLAAEITNPDFFTIHPNGRFLYAVLDVPQFEDKPGGAVAAFSIDPSTHKLNMLAGRSSEGRLPCDVNIDRSQSNLVLVNYSSSSTVSFRLNPDGSLGESVSVIQHPQERGANCVIFSKNGRFIVVADSSSNQYVVYQLDPDSGKLERHAAAQMRPGFGPRRFAFHPNYRFAYGLNEVASSITSFTWQESMGALAELQTIAMLPPDYHGRNSAAEVRVHPNGRYVYASNRGHDSLACYSADSKRGTLTLLEIVAVGGKTPRNFRIDPTGKWLIATNQGSDSLTIFRIDLTTGRLRQTGEEKLSQPVCVKFLA
jgi:6-phosphogluconolactonase